MRYGDLSNEVPKRILITTDLFMDVSVTYVRKKRLSFKKIKKQHVDMRRELLSKLYLFNDRSPYNLELISFDFNHEELSQIMDELDIAGTNPFRYFTPYDSIEQLMSDLPFKPEVVGVIDKPERLLRYGSWGLDLTRI